MSLFGSTNAGNNIFGSANTNNGTPAANQSAGGSLFGSFGTQSTNNANTQQPGTSLFGSTNTNTNTQQPLGGSSLFAGSNTNTTSSGANPSLFGSNTGNSLFAKPATNTGTGLFGSTNTVSGTNPLLSSTTAQPAAGNAGFFATPPGGQQQQQNVNQPKPGLFGAPNPLFGGASTNTNPLFGGSATTGQSGTGSLFGSTNSAPATNTTGSTLGGSSIFGGNNTLGTSTLGMSALGKPAGGLVSSTLGTQSQSADAQLQFSRLQEKMEAIVGAWNAQNPATCRFQHYFYNIVEPSQVNLYGRPPNAVNDALWHKAMRENPDSTCLVPVLAIGFDDLRGRVDAQASQSAGHKEKLLELQKKLQTLSTNHSTLTVPRLQRYSALQTQLTHRLLKLVQHLHLLIPSVRSSAINENEETLRGTLEEVVSEVGVSGNSRSNNEVLSKGRLKSKLGELWAVIGALKAREQSLNATIGGNGEWKVVDEDGLARIAQILSEQQAGLAHLTKILSKDLKDLAVIMGTAGVGEDLDESVLGSSRDNPMRGSTLRLSALH